MDIILNYISLICSAVVLIFAIKIQKENNELRSQNRELRRTLNSYKTTHRNKQLERAINKYKEGQR